MPNKGNYPRSCSTALGPWPGAISNGTKSVFDAWGSKSNYIGVKYWLAPELKTLRFLVEGLRLADMPGSERKSVPAAGF